MDDNINGNDFHFKAGDIVVHTFHDGTCAHYVIVRVISPLDIVAVRVFPAKYSGAKVFVSDKGMFYPHVEKIVIKGYRYFELFTCDGKDKYKKSAWLFKKYIQSNRDVQNAIPKKVTINEKEIQRNKKRARKNRKSPKMAIAHYATTSHIPGVTIYSANNVRRPYQGGDCSGK